jgi:hypothetical protein
MERRKFIAGLGSLAAAGAAVTGTGAFTSVDTNRTVSVELAGDSSAYLALERAADKNSDPGANSAAFVDDSGGTISFNFSNTNDSRGLGDGFNVNAVTKINDLLEMRNQGTQSTYISVDLAGLGFIDDGGNNPYVGLAVKSGPHATSYENENIVYNSLVDNSWGGVVPDPREDGAYELKPGESVNLDLIVDTTAVTGTIALPAGTLKFTASQEPRF